MRSTTMVEYDGEMVEVLDPLKDKMEKGFAYVHGDFFYIYRGKIEKQDQADLIPGSVYKGAKGNLVWVKPEDEDMHSVERIMSYNIDDIAKEITDRRNLKDIDPALLEQAEDYFAPKIVAGDNVLKRIIKKVLEIMKVNIKAYKGSKNDYDITNMKSALTKSANMSFNYFTKWAEVLHLNCKITVTFIDPEGEEHVVEEDI